MGDAARATGDRDGLDDRVRLGADACQRPRKAVGHPDGVAPGRDPVGPAVERDGLDDGAGLRVDPLERAPRDVAHPDRARGQRELGRAPPDVDRRLCPSRPRIDEGDRVAGDRRACAVPSTDRQPDPEPGRHGEDGGAEGDQRTGAPEGDRTTGTRGWGARDGWGSRHRRHRGRQRGVLGEDAPLEVLQGPSGLDAQLLGEGAAAGGVPLERLGLAAAPVEREHELATQPLAQRVLLDERLELAHEVAVAPELEVRLDPLLQAGEARFLEAGDLALGPLLIGEVGERRPAPQGECLAERRRRAGGVTGRERRASGGRQLLKAVEVELPGRQVQEVTGRAGLDRAGTGAVGRHGPAQLGDVHLHGLACGRRGRLPPELGDQPLGRDDLVRAQQQERQQGPLAEPSERDGPIAVEDLERPQDPECRGHESAANVPRRARIRVAVRGAVPSQRPF